MASAAQFENARAIDHRLQQRFIAMNGAVDDAVQIFARRIADENLHEKTVELGLGQRVRTLHFDRVLRGHYQERNLELVRGGPAGDGPLLHGFQEGGLGFGGGAVNFVGQDEISKDWAGLKAEGFGAMIVAFDDHAAHDVSGHEIGSELNPRIFQVKDMAQGSQQCGLAESGDAFQQDVAAGEQADEHAIHDALLADDNFANFLAHLVKVTGSLLDCGVRTHDLILAAKLREVFGRHVL
jgi:hypothetical protein